MDKNHRLFIAAILCFATLLGCTSSLQGQTTSPAQNSSKTTTASAIIPGRWQKLPAEPRKWVNDTENALSPKQEHHLDSLLNVLFNKTTIELYLVTVDSATVRRQEYDSLGLYLLQKWFAQTDSNSYGGLVLISKGFKRIRVYSNEAFGKYISDAEMKNSVEKGFLPGYKAGDFYRGTKEGTTMLTTTLRKNFRQREETDEGAGP